MWPSRLALISLSLALTAGAFAQSSLEAGFVNPPNSAKPHTWWHWINGNISKEGITADLEAMKKIGLGGAQIFNVEVGIPEGGTPFMTPQWQDAMAWAFQEAKRLGIEICVHNCAGWSSSGGPWVKPEDAMQSLTWSETDVHGGATFEGNLPVPPNRLGFYRDVAVYAVRKPKDAAYRIPNIRPKAAFERGDRIAPDGSAAPISAAIPTADVRIVPMGANGHVKWTAPAGEWTLIRMGHTPTGAVNAPSPTAGRGPEVDKMSRTAMDHFWNGMMASVLKDNGPIAKYGLNNALIDSYEVGSQNWTPAFRAEFTARRGYDPLPYLPVVTGRVVGSGDLSERFLWDLRRTVCDLFSDNYFSYFRELCHKNGLQFSTEGYGNGSFDNLQVSGLADIPMGEFWVGGWTTETTKLAASAAHTNGRPVIGAESFTADDVRGRWQVDPYSIKALGDKVFTLGINRYIFHRYTHQPWNNLEPGMTMGPWGMNLERTITWWNQGSAWMQYIARCQYLLQSGRFVADVVAFTGEEGPNDLPFLYGNTVPQGYDYDGCDATVLNQMRVDNGQIVLPSGMRYRVLMLPESKYMTPKTLRKIGELAANGATIVGPKPTMSPSLQYNDAEVQQIANKVWSGKNAVLSNVSVAQALSLRHVAPDLESTRPVNWIHRTVNGSEVYFVANPKYRAINVDVMFRVGGKQPELWNPETGETTSALVWQKKGDRTQVSLRLDPAGSTFVVFRKPASGAHLSQVRFLGEGKEPKAPVITITSARYEAVDGTGGVDVTDKVRSMIARGETEIAATNSNFGDPTYNHVKRLHLVYAINGKAYTRDMAENEVLEFEPSADENALPTFTTDTGRLLAWQSGQYQVDGKSVRATTQTAQLNLSWNVAFQPKRGAPASAQFKQLISWPESKDPGIKYFSGTATYSSKFTNPGLKGGVWLDLGRVKNFAEVSLNGHAFQTLWKAPFRLDVSKWLKAGENELVVKVTNLWPNRLIGDEQYPADANYGGAIKEWPEWIKNGTSRPATQRVTFTTWRFFDKNAPLLESGLIGPVRLVKTQVLR